LTILYQNAILGELLQKEVDMNALTFSFVGRAWMKDFKQLLAGLASKIRRVFTKPRRKGSGGQTPGACFAGCVVPVRPTPSHHLVAAKEFPPSDVTHSYTKD
jgi:hypothetical protein